MKNILTINPGSTSVKYVLFGSDGAVLLKEVFERSIGKPVSKSEEAWLKELKEVGQVQSIGIRIVHGGEAQDPVLVSPHIRAQIRKYSKLAPIHNTLALAIIEQCELLFNNVPIVASFDTAFHTTLPEHASVYPLPKMLRESLHIKRYGFHGIALESVMQQLPAYVRGGMEHLLSAPETERAGPPMPSKVIVAHLGGGCSVTAIKGGKSVDTTMGLTPLSGIMMPTRSGSVGPGVLEHIMQAKGWSMQRVIEVLNTESGIYGIVGSKNIPDIIIRASKHKQPEKLAIDMFTQQIVKQIFAYYGVLQGCDALVFSGGIGYGNAYLRSEIIKKLKILGIQEQHMYTIKVDEARVLFENVKKVQV